DGDIRVAQLRSLSGHAATVRPQLHAHLHRCDQRQRAVTGGDGAAGVVLAGVCDMRIAALIAGGAIVLGFGVGWMAVKEPARGSAPTRAGQVQRPLSGGEIANTALERFAKLAPIPVDPPPDAGPPPPPPPDVAVVFRRELTAIDTAAREPIVY